MKKCLACLVKAVKICGHCIKCSEYKKPKCAEHTGSNCPKCGFLTYDFEGYKTGKIAPCSQAGHGCDKCRMISN